MYQLLDIVATGESINDSPTPNLANLYISLPVSSLESPYFKTWYLISQREFEAGLGTEAELDFSPGSSLMPIGFYTFPGALHLFKGVCFIPNQGEISVEQIWGFQMEGAGPPFQ